MTPLERAMHAAENAVFNPAAHRCSVSIVGEPREFYGAVVRAVLTAIREPSEGMVDAAEDQEAQSARGTAGNMWPAMIDALLAETE